MKLGIVGLPNVGKSTLFNAITQAGAECANYPFCTIEPNVGVVTVPDSRVDALSKMYASKKTTYATIEFLDIAGLVRGASRGEGLGNQFLSHIRSVDAIVHVVRCFEDADVVHVDGNVDPLRDIETIEIELVLSDIDLISRRIDAARKMAKASKKFLEEAEFLEKLRAYLEVGGKYANFEMTDEEAEFVKNIDILCKKPVLYVANMTESDASAGFENNANYVRVRDHAASHGALTIPVCAKIEEEIALLEPAERDMFLSDLGLAESGLDRLAKASYALLGLISFLTCGEDESRAWTIASGTKAPKAAGKIHSDIERGFIRAEVVDFDELMACGSMNTAKEKGLVRSEGKDYVMRDGDVTLFRFNV